MGTGSAFALAALFTVTVQVRRRRPQASALPQAALVIVAPLLWVVALLVSTPPRQYGSHPPHVITSVVEVAEIAYVGARLAQLAVLVAVRGVLTLARGPHLDD